MLDDYPSPINPLGAKGAGEGGIIAAGGCMANAVANALQSFGVEPRELPLSPAHIWELVQAAEAGGGIAVIDVERAAALTIGRTRRLRFWPQPSSHRSSP